MAEKSNQELFDERTKRVAEAVALEEPDRVPYVFGSRFWPASLKGMTFEEAMYDADRAIDALRDAVRLLRPDAFSATIYAFGKAMETIDYKPMAWPGHGADPNATFQYIDKEYMTADEYDEYLFDPTGFTLRKFLPRTNGALEGLCRFPDFPSQPEWDIITGLRAFADPELQRSLKVLMKAGEEVNEPLVKLRAFVDEMQAEGYPIASGGFCKAPFDHLVDSLRGSRGGMLDLFRNRDKLLESIEKARELLIRGVVEGARAVGCPYVFMPLHWGLDGFMSPEQFKTYYWPALRDIIVYLIKQDLVPTVLWEGDCTTRLELIGDIPAGRAVYWFESTDIFKAKEILGDRICLRGNVPASMLITGTADDVDEYCKKLITEVGKGGGFILDGAASIPDEAKTENVIAMAESVRKYAK